ncbi:potassium uptake TrkH family protein [Christiangramia gaetbulicola]|uniref:Potassium uptake TrkH family protein n=1 Tax=Christiangramia gaetbulicola TaxID=703340 RepID=A0A2T6AEG7_9FLAO|nr:potassium transporter TrkG [Christiangramia gaetbulicola]PTX42215.1 potassium uptake TrkH family protein [Christiangramia gaetbulicola]
MKFSGFRSWLKNERFLNYLNRFSFLLSLITVLVALYDLGFRHLQKEEEQLNHFYFGALLIGVIAILLRYFLFRIRFRLKVRIFDILLGALLTILILVKIDFVLESFPLLEFMNRMAYLYLAALVYFIREFSTIEFNFNNRYLNPAQIFIGSFLLIILAGTALLMLPRATYEGISLLDALFTSTSAVCVTGLIVVDTGSYFTLFGQSIILFLMQIGGLGIMTFASYFSYFFRGQTSYQNQLLLKDATNSEKIGEVFSVLKKILFITFIVELLGAIFIYFSLNSSEISHIGDRLFFSIFHAVSGFCNAGFSTLENSLYEPDFRFNYPLQLIVALLFILGGIGFPIVLNIYKYIKYIFTNLILKIKKNRPLPYSPWVINLNTRIVILTTFVLLGVGTIGFYAFEYNNTLAEHNWFGKIVTAFFSAATPRTAGFNVVDITALNLSTLMMIFLLMWIGASPASTGGGIKTSTIAVATLNFLSLAKGKDRIEVYRREISQASVRRAFSIISLSLLVIGLSIFLIATFDKDKSLLSIAFESFSAYSTVGLSTGITSDLSSYSKVVIIFTMFIGRVSMLTLLIAILRRAKHLNYRYPTDEILIN